MENKILMGLMIWLICFCSFGCSINPAAVNTCEVIWEYKAQIVLDNPNLDVDEKELLIINILQGIGYEEDKIVAEINKLRKLQTRKK